MVLSGERFSEREDGIREFMGENEARFEAKRINGGVGEGPATSAPVSPSGGSAPHEHDSE